MGLVLTCRLTVCELSCNPTPIGHNADGRCLAWVPPDANKTAPVSQGPDGGASGAHLESDHLDCWTVDLLCEKPSEKLCFPSHCALKTGWTRRSRPPSGQQIRDTGGSKTHVFCVTEESCDRMTVMMAISAIVWRRASGAATQRGLKLEKVKNDGILWALFFWPMTRIHETDPRK